MALTNLLPIGRRFKNKQALHVFGTMAGVIITLACFAFPVGAQDPVGGALATLAAATIQAQRWQAAQSATRQANDTLSTRQASDAIATRQAVEVQATRQAIEIMAMSTSQAMSASATAGAYQAEVQATRQAVESQATLEARQVAQVETERQERQARASEMFLYAALAVGIVGLCAILWRVYRTVGAIGRRTAESNTPCESPEGEDDVVDGELVERNRRGLNLNVITDPVSIQKFEDYVLEHGQ